MSQALVFLDRLVLVLDIMCGLGMLRSVEIGEGEVSLFYSLEWRSKVIQVCHVLQVGKLGSGSSTTLKKKRSTLDQRAKLNPLHEKNYEREGLHSCTCLGGSLAEAKRACTKPDQSKGNTRSSGTAFRHADTNLANHRTSAWFMKSLRRDALLGGAELNSFLN
eukprot:1146909-Pelagomonas_calceolata.AAC.1